MKVLRYVSNDFSVRASAVNATEVVTHMQGVLNAYPLATLGVGRAMVGAILMSSHLKPGQEVGIYLKGNGPLVSLYAQASHEGAVRGYCPHAQYQAPHQEDITNVGKALGAGSLTVSRQQPFQKSPHYGTVELVSGNVGEDIAHYLEQSQQIRSVVALGVYLDSFGKVKSAGGVLIEVMPGVEDSVVDKIEANVKKYGTSISQAILAGAQPEDFVKQYLDSIPFTNIPHDFEVIYSCPCTVDRVTGALTTLGVDELESMVQEEKPAEIQCQMCGKNYVVSTLELTEIKESLRKSSMH